MRILLWIGKGQGFESYPSNLLVIFFHRIRESTVVTRCTHRSLFPMQIYHLSTKLSYHFSNSFSQLMMRATGRTRSTVLTWSSSNNPLIKEIIWIVLPSLEEEKKIPVWNPQVWQSWRLWFRSSLAPCFNRRRWDVQTYHARSPIMHHTHIAPYF